MVAIQKEFGISERHACKLLGQNRSSQRYLRVDERIYRQLSDRVRVLREEFPYWGYRKMWAQLRHEGFRVTQSRVYQLYLELGFTKQCQKYQNADSANAADTNPQRGQWKNHIWAMDVTTSQTLDGRKLHWFAVIDEFTRVCVVLTVIDAPWSDREILTALDRTMEGGRPLVIRVDNNHFEKEQVAARELLERGITLASVPKSRPWHNGVIESFWAKFKQEWLSQRVPENLGEAQQIGFAWKEFYNSVRHHSSLNYSTPWEFEKTQASSY